MPIQEPLNAQILYGESGMEMQLPSTVPTLWARARCSGLGEDCKIPRPAKSTLKIHAHLDLSI